jgi:hypothetical protein
MRNFHIMDRNTLQGLLVDKPGIHYIDLNDTYALVSLPPGIQHDRTKLTKEIGRHPQFSLLAEKIGATANDSVFDLAEKAQLIHPLMGL